MSPKINIRVMIIFLTILFIVPICSANVVDDILLPFEGLELSATYNSYSGIIDFLIYTVLFIGLAQVTLGKKFDSNGGKAVIVSIGLILAIGLAISESVLGFNLRSFGPLAASIFIVFVAMVIYLGFKAFGMDTIGSASLTLVLTYFSIRAITPGFFDWMMANPQTSWLHSMIVVAVLISIYKLFRLFFHGSNSQGISKGKDFIKSSTQKSSDFFEDLNRDKKEKKYILSRISNLTSLTGVNIQKIISALKEIKKIIIELGKTKKGKVLLAEKIESIIPKHHQVSKKIETLKATLKNMTKLDLSNFNNLQNTYSKTSSNERKELDKEVKDEWTNIKLDKQILIIDNTVSELDKSLNHSFNMIIASLKTQRNQEALSWTEKAITVGKNLLKSLYKIEKLEKQLSDYLERK